MPRCQLAFLARFSYSIGRTPNRKAFLKKRFNLKLKYNEHSTISRQSASFEEKVGGIIIPDTAKEKPLNGTIVAVGEGTKDEKMILKEGDNVLYGKYAGTELEYEGKKYLMMRQSDVLAIVK